MKMKTQSYGLKSTDEGAPTILLDAKDCKAAVLGYAELYFHNHHTFITTIIRLESASAAGIKFYRVDRHRDAFEITEADHA